MDYSVSGNFGAVRLLPTCVPSGRFRSADHILSMGWHRVNELYCIERPHGLDTNILFLTRSGNGCITIDGKQYTASGGTAFIIPKNRSHGYGALHGEEWEFFWMHYQGEHSQNRTDDILAGNIYGLDIGLENINSYMNAFEFRSRNEVENDLLESALLDRILLAMLQASIIKRRTPNESTVISQMIDFMENNSGQCFNLLELSAQYHYSREYIIRLFKEATGITPYSYWRRFRLKQSCNALLSGCKSIGQIANEYGYSSISSYTNQFKKLFGISPTDYKNAHIFH